MYYLIKCIKLTRNIIFNFCSRIEFLKQELIQKFDFSLKKFFNKLK